jgi:hypothetical protein
MSLTIDIQPLLSSIQSNLPWVMALLAIPAGIGIAFRLVQYLVGTFDRLF